MIGIALLLISGFLAINMGASGFSVSFAPSYGSRVLSKKTATFLYGMCVLAGGVLIGPRVAATLATKIYPASITPFSGLLILTAACVMMFASNLLKIPQSTSFISVASFVGAGLYHGSVNWKMVEKIIITALIFSAVSFAATFLIKGLVYPPHRGNLRFYEKFHFHRNKFRRFIIFHDMYSAFGIGTNNVANVVAPLVASLSVHPVIAIAIAAPFFGLGAHIFGEKVINTVSRDIVPIGEISATIVSTVTATFVIIASLLGLPTPYVQFATFSILAISCVKDGLMHTMGKAILKRLLSVWLLGPVLTALLSFALHALFMRG